MQQTYSIVVTVSEKNEVQAFKLTVDPAEPLFEQIKADPRSRIQETAVSDEALLPEGPYDLWRSGETSPPGQGPGRGVRPVPAPAEDAQPAGDPRHADPGVPRGHVRPAGDPAPTARPARSGGRSPTRRTCKNTGLEVVLPEAAELAELPPSLLLPQALPGLGRGTSSPSVPVRGYFAGGQVIKVPRQGYDEPVTIPKADRAVVEKAIGEAVQVGQLWLVAGQASLWSEAVPPGVIVRRRPPASAAGPDRRGGHSCLTSWRRRGGTGRRPRRPWPTPCRGRLGGTLPWPVRPHGHRLGPTGQGAGAGVDSGPWPCEFAGASAVRLLLPGKSPDAGKPPDVVVHPEVKKKPGVVVAEADLNRPRCRTWPIRSENWPG